MDEAYKDENYTLSLRIGDIGEVATVSMHHHYAIMVHMKASVNSSLAKPLCFQPGNFNP
jgi:hypothetical protein